MKKMPKTADGRAKTRQQLAAEYGLHRNTFTRRLKRAGIQLPPGLVYPKEQQKIYEILGAPPNLSRNSAN
jgi:hypothetical protein